MRKLIAAMKTSLEGKIEGPEGYADWVESWLEDHGLTSQVDVRARGRYVPPIRAVLDDGAERAN